MEIKTQQYTCDNITLSLDSDQIGIVKSWIEARNDKIKELEEKETTFVSQLDGEKARVDDIVKGLKTQLANEKQQRENDQKLYAENLDTEVSKRVKARIALERKVIEQLDETEVGNLDSLSDRQIKEKIIKKTSSFTNLDKYDDNALNAMFELALAVKNQDQLGSIKPNIPDISPVDQNNLRTVIDNRSKDVFKHSFTLN